MMNNLSDDLKYKYVGFKEFEGYIMECDVPLENWEYGTLVKVKLYEKENEMEY